MPHSSLIGELTTADISYSAGAQHIVAANRKRWPVLWLGNISECPGVIQGYRP